MTGDGPVRALVELGLSARDGRAYVALLRHSPVTAAELADAAAIARPKVYEALKSLEQRGFVVARGDRVARYHPVDPEVALAEWARRRDQQRRTETERDERVIGDLVRELPSPRRPGSPSNGRYMDAKIGIARTLEVFADVMARASRRLDIVVSAPVMQERSQWNASELAALGRDVDVRVIYSTELVSDPERYAPLVETGAQIRRSDDLPVKMIVRDDGVEAAVSLVGDGGQELVATSVLIGHPELAAPFQLLFNRQWRQATDVRPQ